MTVPSAPSSAHSSRPCPPGRRSRWSWSSSSGTSGSRSRSRRASSAARTRSSPGRTPTTSAVLPRFERQIPLVQSGLDIVGSAIEEFEDESEDEGVAEGHLVRVPPLTGAEIERAVRFRSPFNHP